MDAPAGKRQSAICRAVWPGWSPPRLRVLRPDMPRIAPAHVGAHLCPGAAPEARQVARRLDRPVRRRQEFERQRHGAVAGRRMTVEAEQFLHPDRQHRRIAVVADRHAAAGRRVEMGRRRAVDLPLQVVRNQRQEAGADRAGIDARKRRLAGQEGTEPVVAASPAGRRPTRRARDAPTARCSQPRRRRSACVSSLHGSSCRPCAASASRMARSASAPRGGGSIASDSTMAPRRSGLAHPDGAPADVEFRHQLPLEAVAQNGADVRFVDRRGRGDARILRLALQVGDDEDRPARPAGRLRPASRQSRWPAHSGRARRAPLPRGPARHGGGAPLHPGRSPERSGGTLPAAPPFCVPHWHAATGPSQNGRAVGRDRRSSPPRPRSVISIARSAALCGSARAGDHVREPDGQSEPTHRLARFGDAPVRIDRVEGKKQAPCLGKRRCRRWVQKGEACGVGNAEGGAVEHQRGEVGLHDLGRGIGLQRAGLLGPPQPDRDAWLGAPRAPRPLVGRSARDAHRFEPRQAGGGFVARHARQARIDDDAHAVDGDRGFRDRACQHHLAASGRRGPDRSVLRAGIQHAVERHDIHIGGDPPSSRSAVRSISRWPGRKASTLPGSAASVSRIAEATASSIGRPGARSL